MTYRGDIALEQTIDFKFTSRRFSTGAPFTLAGTPSLAAYVGNSTTEITAGITLSVDFDGVTGLNNVRVAATAGNGYTAGTDVEIVIAAGTVDSVSVVGEVVGSFSIANRSALRPTVSGRTLDVAATGEAGLDFNNVLSSSLVTLHSLTVTGATTLTGAVSLGSTLGVTGTTTLAAVTTTGTVTLNALTVSNATTLTGAVSLGSTLGITGTTTIAALTTTGTVTLSALTVSNATTLTGAVSLGSTLGVTGTTTLAALTTTGTATLNALTVSNATTLTGAVTATNAGNDIKGISVTTNLDKTGYAIGVGGIDTTAFAAGAIDAAAIAANAIASSELAASAAEKIADALLARNVAGGSNTGRIVKEALYALRNRCAIAAGTLTVYLVDDTTPSWDAAVTTAAGNPLSEIDPS